MKPFFVHFAIMTGSLDVPYLARQTHYANYSAITAGPKVFYLTLPMLTFFFCFAIHSQFKLMLWNGCETSL